MKYFNVFLFAFAAVIFSGCSKSSSNGGVQPAPSNLKVSVSVNTDNSGNVTFTASANNAVSFDYDYGNGIFQTVATGAVTYKYPATGTYTVNVIAKNSGGQTISQSVQVTVSVGGATGGLSLVWSDEFNTDGTPDPSKWGYDTGGGGWGNNELEYYTSRSSNVSISSGTLKITAAKENYNGSSYTSARMLSKDKFSFKYGKIEISAKLPAGVGTWPAIWMLGGNFLSAGWPACGEMDIMEHRGSELNKIYGTLHYPGHSGANGNGKTTIIQNSSTAFHLYAMEWTASTINFLVDNNVYFTVP